jgi:hypothetical protein
MRGIEYRTLWKGDDGTMIQVATQRLRGAMYRIVDVGAHVIENEVWDWQEARDWFAKHHAGRTQPPEDEPRPEAKRARKCGCSGCLSGHECIDPYNAGGL